MRSDLDRLTAGLDNMILRKFKCLIAKHKTLGSQLDQSQQDVALVDKMRMQAKEAVNDKLRVIDKLVSKFLEVSKK